tara:strand:+ start:373 stop:846 length:474 start_codon:yes stop_codon:yes gene_type:complete
MSNVNANTIRAANGSLGTDIRVKNTSVYESDGGTSVTQNLVQSMCKTWCDYNAQADGNTNISIADSFNVASLVDNGTGDYTFAHANDMASGNYVFLGDNQYEAGAIGSVTTLKIKSGSTSTKAAATMRVASQYSNTSGNCTQYDYAQQQFAVHGDLA